MYKQQIPEIINKIQDDNLGAFQQFTEQYMTYSTCIQTPHENLSNKTYLTKPNSDKHEEKAKLKILSTKKITENQNFLNNYRKLSPHKTLINSKVLYIGNAIFRSDFESGNIQAVSKLTPNTYEIILNSETNSQRISAWFNFICEGLKGQIKFIIKGFRKTTSLFNSGMKICYKEGSNPWRRGGTKIQYVETSQQDQYSFNGYQLRFSYFFKANSSNQVQFAYCFPYTYHQLLIYLDNHSQSLSYKSIGKSFEGRHIPQITIGNQKSQNVIVITARAHPGETVGSWMMQGFLNQLISQNDFSKNLRETFLFKIIPMINVDGVCQGNYRFSASGFDLNRKWKNCNDKYHPQIHIIKNHLLSLHKDKKIVMFIDLHGHSRQKNVFFYGCCPKNFTAENGYLKAKQFPFLMSKIYAPFRYDYCSFNMQKDKQGTARITMWRQLQIDTIYTLQASFCGSEGGQNYQINDYQKIGAKLCYGLSVYFSKNIQQTLNESTASSQNGYHPMHKMVQMYQKNISQLYNNPQLAKVSFQGNSSDSQPQAGQIPPQNRKSTFKKTNINKKTQASKATKQQNYISPQVRKKQKYRSNKFEQENKMDSISLNTSSAFNPNNSPQKIQTNRRQLRTSNGRISKNNSLNISPQMKQKTIHDKLHQLSKMKNTNQPNSIILITTENTQERDHYQSEQISKKQINYQKNTKKKAVCFEGAQYRRVRKLAEQHNRRLFSVQNIISVDNKKNPACNFLEIDQIKPKQKTPSFFPSKNNKNNNIEMHFRKQIKAKDYTARRFQINGISHEVKSYSKKIQ